MDKSVLFPSQTFTNYGMVEDLVALGGIPTKNFSSGDQRFWLQYLRPD